MGFDDPAYRLEVARPLHPRQGHMGLPRPPFAREAEGIEGDVQRRGDLRERLRTLDANPNHVHVRCVREGACPLNPDFERRDIGGRLSDYGDDFRDKSLLHVSKEFEGQVKLVRAHHFQR